VVLDWSKGPPVQRNELAATISKGKDRHQKYTMHLTEILVAGAEFHANGESDRSRISDPDLVRSGDGPRPAFSPLWTEVADHTFTSCASKTTTTDKLLCSPLIERREG
jgi:hypothetical protein